MNLDQAIIELQKINWDGMTVTEARQEAVLFMNSWDWQEKVPEYSRIVNSMNRVVDIASFMWNATMKGLKLKQRATVAALAD